MIRPDLTSLPAYVPGTTVPGALKLASNESSLAPLPSVAEFISETTGSLNRYPDMAAVDIRGELATFVQQRDNVQMPLTWNNVSVGNGSSALCLQSIQATCAAGDEVLFAWRSFEAYPILAKIAAAVPVQVPLDAEGKHDLDAMAQAITERTRLIFVCNPNNPTGTTVTVDEFRDFMSKVPGDVQVVLDEAYTEYDRTGTSPGAFLLDEYENLAICRTFSKAYGLAGLRLGYIVGAEEFIGAVNKVGIPFGVNAVAQAAGLASLRAQEELTERVEATVQQRERVSQALGERALPSQANFVWLPLGERAADLDAAMKQRGIIPRCFPGEGVRITITTEEEMDQLLKVLPEALEELDNGS
ncbi:pyridoxal phosphate-dependent aminotransferase [Corynebacterium dentalis]|uniref:pyridoxal phosphate-dependent aminotransferase n=1 Tax=Corynebacterium dentalis TaxID=2014528 RepID=UPI00289A67B7|nr:pyridoxal phosphate-dependent aminotransferase [Corynebacterium dentalis]